VIIFDKVVFLSSNTASVHGWILITRPGNSRDCARNKRGASKVISAMRKIAYIASALVVTALAGGQFLLPDSFIATSLRRYLFSPAHRQVQQ
jgi:hypothetical protein